ncbi:MAG: sulfurtransferase TusA family protein [Ktedonobacterales bacterium]
MTTAGKEFGAPNAPGAARHDDDPDQSPTFPLSMVQHGQAERAPAHPLSIAPMVLDLGDKDCGDGPLEEIAKALLSLPAGTYLEVRTTDRDVAVALVAWCRLVGHSVVQVDMGHFVLAVLPSHTTYLSPLGELRPQRGR